MAEEDDNPDGVPNDLRPRLTRWAAIEDFLKEFDKTMVDDLNDDINTLLVFAGLFSAVLTAFVIVSYTWLQVDNTQSSVQLLSYISLQLANSSIPAAPQNEPFEPAATAVWMNTLWFLSLVLSLASALFGMMTKQWLREYMQWASMSSVPEDLVRLRQGRYEAFLGWRAPAIISSIPALLELALILFLVGLVILLWTLNGVVATICTVAIAILIILAFTATVLPAFCPKCPYKSPTGWACILTGQAYARFWNNLTTKLLTHVISCFHPRISPSALEVQIQTHKDWRERDLELQFWNGVDEKDLHLRVRYPWMDRLMARDIPREAGQVYTLSRALIWIREISQDVRLLDAVDQCSGIRMTRRCDDLSLLVIDFHIACTLLGVDVDSILPNIEECYTDGAFPVISDVEFFATSLRLEFAIMVRSAGKEDRYIHHTFSGCNAPILTQVQVVDCLALDLSKVFDKFFDSPGRACPPEIARLLMSSLVLVGFLMCSTVSFQSGSTTCSSTLALLFRRLMPHSDLSAVLPGFRSLLFHLIRECEDMFGCYMLTGLLASGVNCAKLALQLPNGPPEKWTRDDADLLVHISSSAIRDLVRDKDYTDNAHVFKVLFEHLEDYAEHERIRPWPDGGSDFVWVHALHTRFTPNSSHWVNIGSLMPRKLVRLLADRQDQASFNGEPTSVMIGRLINIVESEEARNAEKPDNDLIVDDNNGVFSDGKARTSSFTSSLGDAMAFQDIMTPPHLSPGLSDQTAVDPSPMLQSPVITPELQPEREFPGTPGFESTGETIRKASDVAVTSTLPLHSSNSAGYPEGSTPSRSAVSVARSIASGSPLPVAGPQLDTAGTNMVTGIPRQAPGEGSSSAEYTPIPQSNGTLSASPQVTEDVCGLREELLACSEWEDRSATDSNNQRSDWVESQAESARRTAEPDEENSGVRFHENGRGCKDTT